MKTEEVAVSLLCNLSLGICMFHIHEFLERCKQRDLSFLCL